MRQTKNQMEQLRTWANALEDKRRRDALADMAPKRRFEDREPERFDKHIERAPIYRAIDWVKDNQPLVVILVLCGVFLTFAWNV